MQRWIPFKAVKFMYNSNVERLKKIYSLRMLLEAVFVSGFFMLSVLHPVVVSFVVISTYKIS